MISDTAFEALRDRFSTSSWAVWNEDEMMDTSVVEDNREVLHNQVVFAALNPSDTIERDWGNFHGTSPGGRKLRRLLNQSSYRGAYMTDLIKTRIEPDASQMRDIDADVLAKNVQLFREEMNILGAEATTLFVLFGQRARQLFCKHLSFFYRNAVLCTHYAYYGVTSETWVENARETLTAHWEKTERIDARNEEPGLNTPKFVPRA